MQQNLHLFSNSLWMNRSKLNVTLENLFSQNSLMYMAAAMFSCIYSRRGLLSEKATSSHFCCHSVLPSVKLTGCLFSLTGCYAAPSKNSQFYINCSCFRECFRVTLSNQSFYIHSRCVPTQMRSFFHSSTCLKAFSNFGGKCHQWGYQSIMSRAGRSLPL